ncbi:MAG: YbjN domain-containing protein [Candidatus Methanomethylicaceae archaeon]
MFALTAPRILEAFLEENDFSFSRGIDSDGDTFFQLTFSRLFESEAYQVQIVIREEQLLWVVRLPFRTSYIQEAITFANSTNSTIPVGSFVVGDEGDIFVKAGMVVPSNYTLDPSMVLANVAFLILLAEDKIESFRFLTPHAPIGGGLS